MRTATPHRGQAVRSTELVQRALPSFSTTSRVLATNHQSLLAELRSVTPIRPLHFAEALQIAELQANKLRARFDAEEAIMPSEAVTSQPRMHVVLDSELDGRASGSSHWNGTSWIIALNEREPLVRRRFSLFHEYKHIVDDRFRSFLYQDEGRLSSAEKAERVADYFAACVLMPKRLVKRFYCSGVTNLGDLAEMFDVSEKAMGVRIAALGLGSGIDQRRVRQSGSIAADPLNLKTPYTRLNACSRGRTS